jgi:hypothetical protein
VALSFVMLLVQVRVNVVLPVRSPVRKVPLVGSVPLQPPDAAQPVALLELQVNVVVPLYLTVLGVAVNVVMATGGALTVTVVDCEAVPPVPEQESV